MSLKRIIRILKRTLKEIILDLRNKDFRKIIHFLFFIPKQIILKYPKNISLEPINACNLKCEFCSSPPKLLKRNLQVLKLEEFKAIINNIKDITHYLWLFLAGDPFLNPNFPQMIACATKNNLHVTTSTNALLINKEKAGQIVKAGLDCLIVSFDGATKKSYETMRRGGDFEKLLKNINFILEEKRRQHKVKPEILLQFLVSKINQHEKRSFIKIANGLGVNYCFKTFGVPTWIYDKNFCEKLANKYLPDESSRYDKNKKIKRSKNCVNNERSFILSNGDIAICCYDLNAQFKIGNAIKENFKDIWQNKKYKKIRQAMTKRQLKICQTCGETDNLYE